jgi:hypothetical protein
VAQRIIVALVYAVGIVIAAFQATGTPQTPEAWIGLVIAFIGGFWAKFSSSQTIVAMNRPVWTDSERAKESLAELNKGIK